MPNQPYAQEPAPLKGSFFSCPQVPINARSRLLSLRSCQVCGRNSWRKAGRTCTSRSLPEMPCLEWPRCLGIDAISRCSRQAEQQHRSNRYPPKTPLLLGCLHPATSHTLIGSGGETDHHGPARRLAPVDELVPFKFQHTC